MMRVSATSSLLTRGVGAILIATSTMICLACRSTRNEPPYWPRPGDWVDVKEVDRGALHLADGRELRVAGVTLSARGTKYYDVGGFMKAATRQGIHVDRRVGERDEARMSCAPYFVGYEASRWADARIAMVDLGELLVATGYATVDDTSWLTTEEADRLVCAQAIAQFFRWGPWSRERKGELAEVRGGSDTWHGGIYHYDVTRGLRRGVESALRCACGPVTPDGVGDCQIIADFARARVRRAREPPG